MSNEQADGQLKKIGEKVSEISCDETSRDVNKVCLKKSKILKVKEKNHVWKLIKRILFQAHQVQRSNYYMKDKSASVLKEN